MRRPWGSATAAAFVVALSAAGAAARSRCDGAKLTATGKGGQAGARCVAKGAATGAAVDPACAAKAAAKLATALGRAETGADCSTTGNAASIQAKLDAHVAGVRAALWTDEPAENDCAAAKLRAAGKKGRCKLRCAAVAARRGAPVAPACLQKCEARFASAFAKAESRGGCTTGGDAAAVEVDVDAFVADVSDALQPPPASTTSTTTTSTTTSTSVPAACGDGVALPPEECDDGNGEAGDGCSPTCDLERVNPAVCAGVPSTPGTGLDTVRIASGLEAPVHVAAPRLDPSRVFIVEQPGRIRVVTNGVLQPAPFLEIEDAVRYGGEEGLLSVAFDPDYETNRFFYVYYVDNAGDLVIARYEASSANPDDALEASEHVIITIPHPTFGNHNGGNLNFGPDGFLYAATGDGGGGGDPNENAQNDASLLGKLLRIDVDTDAVTVWAKGLRNPFRWSFDRGTGDLWVGDVGQGRWEEIDFDPAPVTAGENYGWDDMEGRHCFEPSSGCLTAGRVLPVLEYCNQAFSSPDRNTFQSEKGRAVVGGFVYRGCALPDLHGHYFYSDTFNSFIKTVSGVAGGDAQNLVDRTADLDPPGALAISAVTSFGEDARGELYLTDYADGEVYRIVPGT